jgi:hypothetical protein
VGKEAKHGFTCMVASTAAGTLMTFLLIAKGTTHAALDKFVKPQAGFNVRGGGAQWAGESKNATTRHTRDKKVGYLAVTPPHYYDADTGHIVCAGDSSHWVNASTQRLWVSSIVWPH